MSRTPTLLAAALATAASLAHAQTPCPTEPYGHNWAPMHQPIDLGTGLLFSGPGLFTGGSLNFASPGDAIRVCYGIDSTQGGRNHLLSKQYEVTAFRLLQGFAPANTVAGVDVGEVSIRTASESDLGGDACFAPFFVSTGNTGGSQLGASFPVGLLAGTAGAAVPTVWDVKLQIAGGSSATGSVRLGVDPVNTQNPLLANLILEIEGPATGGPSNNQYYMASIEEETGRGLSGQGTGGVTNGNRQWGFSLFGATADVSGAISHSRVLSSPPSGGLFGFPPPHPDFPGLTEFAASVAFRTPVLWAQNDGNWGAGGPDWRVSQAPVSIVDMRYLDQLSGAETTTNVLWKSGGAGGPSTVFDPCIAINQAFFLWSATPVCGMQQMPFSWDDLACAIFWAQCGGFVLGSIPTSRTTPPMQSVPINFDALTMLCLQNPGVSLGTPFSPSDDPCLDGVGADTSFCEGGFDEIVSGISTRSGGPMPAVNTPMANLRGVRLGAAGLGLQFDACLGILRVTEVGNGVTLVLQ